MPKLDAAALLAGLSSLDDLERSEARRSILQVKADTEVDVDVLIGGLESNNPEVATFAAYSLRFLGARVAKAIPRLIALLSDKPLKVKQAILAALALIDGRNPLARSTVLGALRDAEPAMRVQALNVCTFLPDLTKKERAAIESLRHDPVPAVVKQCQHALHLLALQRGEPPPDDEPDEGEFDADKFFAELTRVVRAQRSFQIGMKHMLRWCSRHLPHDDWKKVAALDLAADERAAVTWLPVIFKKHPPPFPVRGLYFHLSERTNAREEEYAVLAVAFTGQYRESDRQFGWARGPKRHDPPRSELRAKALKAAGLIFNRENGQGLGNEGYMMYAMSYATLLVASLLTSRCHALLGARDEIGLLVGWNSGDLMRLGRLTAKGFKPKPGAMI